MMPLMILASLALAQASSLSEPVSADCTAVGDVQDGRILSLDLRCPDDVIDAVQLQHYASRVAAQMAMPIDINALAPVDVRGEVEFEYRDGAWILPAPSAFLTSPPRYPARAAERNLDGRCDVRLTALSDGRSSAVETLCQAFRGGSGRPARSRPGFERTAIEALNRWRWFVPLDENARCSTTGFDYSVGASDSEKPWLGVPLEGAPTCSEPA